MSGQMFAAYLCATQLDGRIQTDGGPVTLASPKLLGVFHGGHDSHRERYETVRVVLRDLAEHRQWIEDLEPRHVVTVENPD